MNDIIITIISTVATAVVLPLIAFAGNALIRWMEQKTKNEKLTACLMAATDIVISAVEATAQTYVDSLKHSGTFTAEAHIQAFQLAKNKALLQITAEAKAYIAENFGNFDVWLDTQIEAAVLCLSTKCS